MCIVEQRWVAAAFIFAFGAAMLPEARAEAIPAMQSENHNQLKWLLDYTLFHIGAYITLSTLLVGLLGLEGFKQRISTMKPFLIITLFCFIIAGMCGGTVASHIPYFPTFDKFKDQQIGPTVGWSMPVATWMFWEHFAFWSGILVAFLGVVVTALKYPRRQIPPADVVDLARRLGKETYDASLVAADAEDRKQFGAASDLLRTLAENAQSKSPPASH